MNSTHVSEQLTFELNPEQHKAVVHTQGSLLLVAGAGSGKTRVITNRIVFLIRSEQVHFNQIIALTFTNKAAAEMKQRVSSVLHSTDIPFIGTFHSYCFLLLKKHHNYASFTIIDRDDQEKLLKKICQKYNLEKKIPIKQIVYGISQIKNQIYTRDAHNPVSIHNAILNELYQEYEYEKTISHCFDFDDILIKALDLFKDTEFRKNFSQKIRHILIDEYQDTNDIQHELLKAMALSNQQLSIDSVCVVGDQDQSIYSWRGATPQNMDHFIKDFPNTSIIKIEQNYRSIQPILHAANELIQHNSQRHPKKLWSERVATHSIILLSCGSEYQEAEVVSIALKQLNNQKTAQTIGILYRTHSQSRTIEETLIKENIPYSIIGGIEFYDRAEIKDIIGYLKLIVNPYDRVSLLRIINTPLRGIGEKYQELLLTQWSLQPLLNSFQLMRYLLDSTIISDAKKIILKNFLEIFDDLTEKSDVETTVVTILKKTNFFSFLKNNYEESQADDKIENIKEFLSAIVHFKKEGISQLRDFLDEISLMQDKFSQNQKKCNVFLMTLHSAKGLEFDSVIIVGLEEQIIPSSRSTQTLEALEEERRLLYVGITRACNRLIMLYAQNRFFYGSLQKQVPSRFVNELTKSIKEHYDISRWHRLMINNGITQWINDRQFDTQSALISNKNNNDLTIDPIKKKSEQPQITIKKFSKKFLSEESNVKKTTIDVLSNKSSFKLHETVLHETYGRGIVYGIESTSNSQNYIIVQFRTGIKKILASYLKK